MTQDTEEVKEITRDTELIELIEENIDELIKDSKQLSKIICKNCGMPNIIVKNSIEHLRAKRDKQWFCKNCREPTESPEPTDKELDQLEKYVEQ